MTLNHWRSIFLNLFHLLLRTNWIMTEEKYWQINIFSDEKIIFVPKKGKNETMSEGWLMVIVTISIALHVIIAMGNRCHSYAFSLVFRSSSLKWADNFDRFDHQCTAPMKKCYRLLNSSTYLMFFRRFSMLDVEPSTRINTVRETSGKISTQPSLRKWIFTL